MNLFCPLLKLKKKKKKTFEIIQHVDDNDVEEGEIEEDPDDDLDI